MKKTSLTLDSTAKPDSMPPQNGEKPRPKSRKSMPRKATPAPISKAAPVNETAVAAVSSAANQLAVIARDREANAVTLAERLGYDGALSVGALEDGIRFYQRRTVEACLELGKRLLLLKEVTPHGEFAARVQVLGIAGRTGQRFMQAALKTSKSATLALLSNQVKSASVFLELVTEDDDVLEDIANMDDVDRLSASQLRAVVREARAEKEASDKLLQDKNAKIDMLSRRVAKAKPDEVLADLQREATEIMGEILGWVRGNLRQSFVAIKNHSNDDHSLFMAGLAGQVQGDLTALREEFQLPDVSTAAERALAAEVEQWAAPTSTMPAH